LDAAKMSKISCFEAQIWELFRRPSIIEGGRLRLIVPAYTAFVAARFPEIT
jgi:hypothetical protein